MSASGTLTAPRNASSPMPLRQADAAPCTIHLLTTPLRPAWEQYVLNHIDGSLFHTLGWHDAVARTFPHEPVYLLAKREGRIVSVLPMFLVASRLAGRTLVSVPYGVGGGILADDDAVIDPLFSRAVETAENRRCVSIDLRSERSLIATATNVDRYVGFERELPRREEEVLEWLPRKARAAARNAESKFGLTISFGDEHLWTAWRLYCMNMRRLASIAYPFAFFEALTRELHHWTCIVRRGDRPVAGLVTFLFNDRVLPYFYGATDEARECSAANFIYWKTMERGVREGFRIFDFGRSRKDNAGSFDFKRFHGFEPRPLGYQQFTLGGASARELTPTNPSFAIARRVWPKLPLGITQRLGAVLSRHIPG